MYRIKCKDRGNKWRIGLVSYKTFEECKERCKELNSVGIKTKIISENELFN